MLSLGEAASALATANQICLFLPLRHAFLSIPLFLFCSFHSLTLSPRHLSFTTVCFPPHFLSFNFFIGLRPTSLHHHHHHHLYQPFLLCSRSRCAPQRRKRVDLLWIYVLTNSTCSSSKIVMLANYSLVHSFLHYASWTALFCCRLCPRMEQLAGYAYTKLISRSPPSTLSLPLFPCFSLLDLLALCPSRS